MKNPISGVISEMKQVTWPTPKEAASLTLFTIVTCAIISLVILGLDMIFIQLRDMFMSL